jgi:hypothetical protein
MSWYNNITTLQNSVCSKLKEKDEISKSIRSLEYIIDLQKRIYNKYSTSGDYDELFSKMFYRFECLKSSGQEIIVSQYIEPLIGLLRDPLTICLYENESIPLNLQLHRENALQSKRFFLLGPSAPYQHFRPSTKSIPPWLYQPNKQKILFDIGCSLFKGTDNDSSSSPLMGSRWFYQYFQLNSLSFDRIIAFDRAPYPSSTFWNQIPDDLMGLFTFINVPVDTRGKFNPWNILKSIANVNDYVIIKLDIDTSHLENQLVQQIINDQKIYSLIDEMFFEMHVNIKEMQPYWLSPPGELKDTYILFHKLRQLGIRMHSWP